MSTWKKTALGMIALAAALLVSTLQPPVAEMQDEGPARFAGTYTLKGSASQAEQKIEEALERGVQDVNFAIRGLALSRLKAKNPLINSVKIEYRNNKFKVTFDGSRSYESPADGSLQNQRDVQGDRIRVGHRVNRGRLQQIFVSESGRRVNTFSLDGNTLRMNVRVTADILPSAVTYRVDYQKQ
ncbi:MAG TPA: hypothetical protein RMF84_11415 [Polyangiaceae bacterium LLY-WYZ-14_1]|nr:hypothetical protein [Polyangiaceae bacterium LLY-WYZ-14_1]